MNDADRKRLAYLHIMEKVNPSRKDETALQKEVREELAKNAEKGRLTNVEMNRLIAMYKIAEKEDLPQQKMLHRAVHDEDGRRLGLSEAEIAISHRQNKHEAIESALYLLRNIDPNAQATMTTKNNKRFDLYKLRGTFDRT